MILAALQQGSDGISSGGIIATGAIGATGVSLIVRYMLGRFDRLEDRVMRMGEDLARIAGALGVKRPGVE